MVAKKLRLCPVALLAVAMFAALTAVPARAEGYTYSNSQGFRTTFYLIGGQYELYVDAHYRPNALHHSCSFLGNFQRVWPTHDGMQLGTPIQIYLVPYRTDSKVTLPAGLYSLYITPLTDCSWTFTIISTGENVAGIAPVQMFRKTPNGMEASQTTSLSDEVEFYAQFRTDHNAVVTASGTLQTIHDGKVVATFPLKVGKDPVSRADVFFFYIQWEPSDAKYLGKNTVKFTVKIGAAEFTSTGEFTLTQ